MDCVRVCLLSLLNIAHVSYVSASEQQEQRDPVEELRMIYAQEPNMSFSEFSTAQKRCTELVHVLPAAHRVEHSTVAWLRWIRHTLPPIVWQIGWLIIWWLFLLYGTLASGVGKKILLSSTIIVMTGIVFLDWYDTTRNDALIVRDDTPARLTPVDDAPIHVQLGRGTRVGIQRMRNGYYGLRGGKGWVAARDCVRIPLDIS